MPALEMQTATETNQGIYKFTAANNVDVTTEYSLPFIKLKAWLTECLLQP